MCPTSELFDSRRFVEACRAYGASHSTLRGRTADAYVPRADHDRVGWSPWQSGFKERDTLHAILPFVWFFLHLKMQSPLSSSSTKRPLMWPTFLGQEQFVTAFGDLKAAGYAPQNWNYALKLKIDTPKINWGIEDGTKSFSWKFELNRTRNRFSKIKQSFGKNNWMHCMPQILSLLSWKQALPETLFLFPQEVESVN